MCMKGSFPSRVGFLICKLIESPDHITCKDGNLSWNHCLRAWQAHLHYCFNYTLQDLRVPFPGATNSSFLRDRYSPFSAPETKIFFFLFFFLCYVFLQLRKWKNVIFFFFNQRKNASTIVNAFVTHPLVKYLIVTLEFLTPLLLLLGVAFYTANKTRLSERLPLNYQTKTQQLSKPTNFYKKTAQPWIKIKRV